MKLTLHAIHRGGGVGGAGGAGGGAIVRSSYANRIAESPFSVTLVNPKPIHGAELAEGV